MTKTNLVRQIKDSVSGRLSAGECKKRIDSVLQSIVKEITCKGRLELRGFGTFEVVERKARKARNPMSGDVVMVPARSDVRFRPSSNMLERLKNQREK